MTSLVLAPSADTLNTAVPADDETQTLPTVSEDQPEHTIPSPNPADTSEGKRAKIWGGRMVDGVQATDGSLSEFSDHCLSVHGLYDAFYSRNGWVRTVFYLAVWIGFGVFFLYLTIPLVQDYQDRVVNTAVDNEGFAKGLPLPIVTVCPLGKGIKCDCLLWRRLHCRYAFEVPNPDWRMRFDAFACTSYFDSIELDDPTWVDPGCDDFGNGSNELPDKCGPLPHEIEINDALANVTADSMFDLITSRETSPDGPYLTIEELIVYGGVRLSERTLFFREGDRGSGFMEPVPNNWIIPSYVEWSRFKVCTQIRPPPDEARQLLPGAYNGLSVLVTEVDVESYPLVDAASATAAVELHVNVIDKGMYDSRYLPVESHTYEPVMAGSVTTFEYTIEKLERAAGYGPQSSRLCKETAVPRTLCAQAALYEDVAEQCGCDRIDTKLSLPNVYSCAGTPGHEETECLRNRLPVFDVSVPLETCPSQCVVLSRSFTTVTRTVASDIQLSHVRRSLRRAGLESVNITKETVFARVGLGSLAITTLVEEPKISFGALMGQIGGNAGLWCGLSFVLMVETLEFGIVAMLYGTGFYSGGHKPLRELVSGMFRRR